MKKIGSFWTKPGLTLIGDVYRGPAAVKSQPTPCVNYSRPAGSTWRVPESHNQRRIRAAAHCQHAVLQASRKRQTVNARDAVTVGLASRSTIQ
jgi:hypothetical protein